MLNKKLNTGMKRSVSPGFDLRPQNKLQTKRVRPNTAVVEKRNLNAYGNRTSQ
jgi:hypothetical protein